MRFHVLAVAHAISNVDYVGCAFTQKVIKFCKMMKQKAQTTPAPEAKVPGASAPHAVATTVPPPGATTTASESKTLPSAPVDIVPESKEVAAPSEGGATGGSGGDGVPVFIYHYGHEHSKVECDEHITVVTADEHKRCYGDFDHKTQLTTYDVGDMVNRLFSARTIVEMKKRKRRGDFILCFFGLGHAAIVNSGEFADCFVVEPGIGYEDSFAKYRVFESYAWMHNRYGAEKTKHGNFYDCVIPNYFDASEFDYVPAEKEDYFLFLGRHISAKGLCVLIDLVRRHKIKILVAGTGDIYKEMGITPEDEKTLRPYLVHVGHADLEKRRRLLARARALIAPTLYLEPFGGVVMEASFSGTPVITTDWGAFPEQLRPRRHRLPLPQHGPFRLGRQKHRQHRAPGLPQMGHGQLLAARRPKNVHRVLFHALQGHDRPRLLRNQRRAHRA